MMWLIVLYMYAFGGWLMFDLYNAPLTGELALTMALWPLLPAIWAPQIFWKKWGRKLYRRLRGNS